MVRERSPGRSSQHFRSVRNFKLAGSTHKQQRICSTDGRGPKTCDKNVNNLATLSIFTTTSSAGKLISIWLTMALSMNTTPF